MPQTTPAAQRAREYEAIYILRPDIDSEGANRVSSRVSEVIGRESGTLTKVESWGRRKLAYPVRKFRRGVYFYVRFVGCGGLVAELERNLRMQKDAVLKFQTVKLSEEVDIQAVKVDPDEVKFATVEPIGEDERDESKERLLGLFEPDYGAREDRMRATPDAYADMRGDEGVEEDADGSSDEEK